MERGHPVAVRHLMLWSQPAVRLFAHARPHLDGRMVSQLLRFAHVLLTIPRGTVVPSLQTYSTFNCKNPLGELTTPVYRRRDASPVVTKARNHIHVIALSHSILQNKQKQKQKLNRLWKRIRGNGGYLTWLFCLFVSVAANTDWINYVDRYI